MYQTIRLDVEGRVGIISLHRPEVRNAFNAEMIRELTELCAQLSGRTDLQVLVFQGAGACFSAGADADWMRASLDRSQEENLADALAMSDMFAALQALPQPVLARVQGAALGGGMGLLAVCDIVLAADDAVFGFTETRLGIIPAVISRFVLPKIGPSWARALYLTGERFGADVAQRIGLVHWVVPPNGLDEAVQAKVDELRKCGPHAVREAKALVADLAGRSPLDLRDVTARRIAEIRTGAEGQEGLRAFLEKRSPNWLSES